MKTVEINRRRYVRVPFERLVSFCEVDEEIGEPVEGRGPSRNISLNGILVTLDRSLDKGVLVDLCIEGKVRQIQARGRVVHSREVAPSQYDTGIEFSQIGIDDLRALHAEVTDALANNRSN